MNIEEYIASGKLELYVLGELSPEEAAEVEDMAGRYPEVEEELLSIQETLQGLAQNTAIQPRAALKDTILNSIGKKSETPQEKTESMAQETLPRRKERVVSWLQYGIAASVTVAMLAIVAALYFRSQWKEAEERISTLLTQNQQIAQQYETANQRLQQLDEALAIMSSRDFQAVEMPGVESSPNSLAYVYWNQNSDQVYLKVNVLPPNPSDKQYQLWAIVEGQPVDAGVFDVTDAGIQRLIAMKNVENASAFAVTLEPRGGSESPTLEAMYVMGEVGNT